MAIEFSKPDTQAKKFAVPSLTISVDENSIREYLALSDQMPLLVLFAGSDPESGNLKGSLESLVTRFDGRILTLVVDPVVSASLAKAFSIEQVPSLFGLLKGQPAPLFSGNQPVQQIEQVIHRVLEVAKENGLTGQVEVNVGQLELELTETQKLAFELIETGDYSGAKSLYEKALLENPNDSLSEAGLAQVNLLLRIDEKNLEELSLSQATSIENALSKADALVAIGRFEEGFDLLLQWFEKTPKTEREVIRERLVELFLVVGIDQESVVKARKKLSLLLF